MRDLLPRFFASCGLATICAIASCLLVASTSRAQDVREDNPRPPFSVQASGCPSSPFAAPEKNDNTFVVDCGPYLDTGCTFRNDGPLVIHLLVGRYVGEVGADGYLLNANELINDGLLPETLTLKMPAYDVDFFGTPTPPAEPERDRVLFNGHQVGFLTGDNNIWILNTFEIDIRHIKFPAAAAPGGTINPVANEIRIDIDVANVDIGDEVWCTAIDWAALEGLKAWRPTILVHGFTGDPSGWNSIWVPDLDELGIKNKAISVGGMSSIQSNSTIISDEVAAMRRRYGVDKVNIVGHSKGGLDSRHYIKNHDDVDNLIMIGTPNGGTPWADIAQGILGGLLGPLPAAIVDFLVSPGGYQLTTAHMALYNLFVGENPATRYTTLAGNHDPGGWCSGSCVLGGEDDEVVQVSSVQRLSYTSDVMHTSDDEFSTHTELLNTGQIFNKLISYVTEASSSEYPASRQGVLPIVTASTTNTQWVPRSHRSIGHGPAVSVTAGFQRTAFETGFVLEGFTNSHTLAIESANAVTFQLFWGIDAVDIELVDPSGRRIDPAVAESDPDIEYSAVVGMGGFKFKSYSIANPPTGNWVAEVIGTDVSTPTGEGYALTAFVAGSSVALVAATDLDFYSRNDPIEIMASLTDGSAQVTGATVMAKVIRPDLVIEEVTLFDDGTHGDPTSNDGQYMNVFANTTQCGVYRIIVVGEGPSGNEFSREDAMGRTVSCSSSEFDGVFDDIGIDSNSDGLYNSLRLGIGINADVGGSYSVTGELRDAAGEVIAAASSDLVLSAGHHTVELLFDGECIFRHGVDGPYTVEQLSLVETGGSGSLIVDFLPTAHTTAPYSVSDFQRPDIFLTGNSDDFGVDSNSDGVFDYLRVEVETDLLLPGFYQWSAKLFDSNGTEIDFDAGSASFGGGTNMIAFMFDGTRIGANAVDGPYFVRDLLMFGSSGANVVVAHVAETHPYEYSLFTSNAPPQALCKNVSVAAGESCDAQALIDNGSYDPDEGDSITLTQTPPGPYPLGDTSVMLIVYDGMLADTCYATVTVIDVTPPEITVELNRDILWPPNHKMVDITARVTVTDDCCARPTFMLVSITSNEPDNGKGDGNTIGDIKEATLGSPDVAFQLRAERSGKGNGRIYTIIYRGIDCSGNAAYDTVQVCVPHDGSLEEQDEQLPGTPRVTALLPSHPNPFNPTTTIPFDLATKERVSLQIFDTQGRLVRTLCDEVIPEGTHEAVWDGRDNSGSRVATGVYFVRFTTGNYQLTKKLIMVR